MAATEVELEGIRDAVQQVVGLDDVRQHALQMVMENGAIPGRHGIDRTAWGDIVKSSLKLSRAELEEKIKDLNDMTRFKQEALRNQLREIDQSRGQRELVFTPRRTRTAEFSSRSDLEPFVTDLEGWTHTRWQAYFGTNFQHMQFFTCDVDRNDRHCKSETKHRASLSVQVMLFVYVFVELHALYEKPRKKH